MDVLPVLKAIEDLSAALKLPRDGHIHIKIELEPDHFESLAMSIDRYLSMTPSYQVTGRHPVQLTIAGTLIVPSAARVEVGHMPYSEKV